MKKKTLITKTETISADVFLRVESEKNIKIKKKRKIHQTKRMQRENERTN